MRTCWYAGLLWLTGLLLSACQSGTLDVGQSVINPQELLIQSVDSVTVQSATVMRSDSFATYSDVDLVVGSWSDPQTGKVTARTYTSLDFSGNPLAEQTTFQFDSLVLELGYSFAYGDTTSAFTLGVHRLNRALPNQFYYNTSSVPYEATPFLQKTVIPQPGSRTRQVRIRFPDAFGKTMYDKLVKNEIDGNTLNNFLTGFAFTGSSSTNAFVGFTAAATSSGLRLYYHSTAGTDVGTTLTSVQFPIANIHFTQLQRDLKGSALSGLQKKSDIIPSQQTGNTTFIVPAAGLQTRIELPYLSEFARPEDYADLNSAILVLGPIRRDFRDNYPLPAQLELNFTNNQNEILGATIVPGGPTGLSSAIGGYTYDANALTLTDYYTFDLTYYIGQIIKRKISNRPMVLSIPLNPTGNGAPPSLRSLVQRVAIGDRFKANDRLQLKLFITSGI
ncbi:DUF4270 family protein [Spirosoma sp. BT702]|uniref:DUF4270 family protein n=1 Tax=Spirosoma profusum TaxID=2771354 RepID=A0A926Y335_9BACT|nr:DUF4270 family protein [Spirosoma profusum]MBD2703038.1 DUF4270 family protein [Spirosoma profusum]